MAACIRKWSLAFFLMVPLLGYPQYSPFYRHASSGSYVQDKNFYLLTLFQQLPEVHGILANDQQLKSLLNNKTRHIGNVIPKNQPEPGIDADKQLMESMPNIEQVARLMKFSDHEIDEVGKILTGLYSKNIPLQQLVSQHLRKCGNFQLFTANDDPGLLKAAWVSTARGLNHIVDVYVLGDSIRYPAIDSSRFDVHRQNFNSLLANMLVATVNDVSSYDLFFEPVLSFDLQLLQANGRDEAARFEPLEALENRKAFQYIRSIDWKKFKYSVILVPGYGPDKAGIEISPLGMMRCDLAAKRYFDGVAPLIAVSGGYVHPFMTPYCEAAEMKKFLMQRHGIPERAIVIEPHARHTTTNFRNVARLIFRYGIPADKKALVTTTLGQSFYITNLGLDKRCQQELGYVPYQLYKRISVNDVEFSPKVNAMHANPMDPLDP